MLPWPEGAAPQSQHYIHHYWPDQPKQQRPLRSGKIHSVLSWTALRLQWGDIWTCRERTSCSLWDIFWSGWCRHKAVHVINECNLRLCTAGVQSLLLFCSQVNCCSECWFYALSYLICKAVTSVLFSSSTQNCIWRKGWHNVKYFILVWYFRNNWSNIATWTACVFWCCAGI